MKNVVRIVHRVRLVSAAALVLVLASGVAIAQDPAPAEAPPADPPVVTPPGSETAPAEGAAAAANETPAPGEPADGVAVNLNNVDIDHVVKFITEITGKPVVKQKDVSVKISVFSPGKIDKKRALSLISDALILEKIAVVEDKDTIKLVPAEMLPEMVVDIAPQEAQDISGGITKLVIPVKFVDVAELEKTIKPLISKNGTLVAHGPSKKIIVTDTASRVLAIKDIVAQLDVLDTEQRQIQVFELEHADPEELAPILKSVLTVLASERAAKSREGQPGQQQQQQQPPQPGQKQQQPGGDVLDVVAYKSANWLVVVATSEILSAAVPLVKEFDREKPKELALHVIPIRYADAGRVADELSQLFQKRPEKRVKDTVEISANARSSSLIVLCSEENYKLLVDLVAELDTEESVQMTTQSFELQYADADDVAEQMNDLYTGMEDEGYRGWYSYYRSSRDEAKTRFVPERRTNSLIVIARPTELPKISELITKLDCPIDVEQVSPRIFHLKYVDATEVTDVLNSVFGSDESSKSGGYYDYWSGIYSKEDEGVGRLYGKVKFVPETTTNSIIVTTNNNENFKIIEGFIQDLDRISPEAANTMVVNLQFAKAKELADQLNTLFAAEGARMTPQQRQQAQEGEQQEEESGGYYSWLFGTSKKKEDKRAISNLIGQVRVVPDIRTNSLTITTAVQNFPLLKELIDKLDVASPKVLVRVRLIEVTATKSSRVGVRYSSDPSVFETDDFDNGLESTFGVTWADVYDNGTINADAGIDIGLLVQFLRRTADARILSEPTLVMNNNEPADIFVGSRIPFITNSQTTAEGGVVQSFEYKDAGTTMKITPNINELDKVEMKVELESSQIRPGEVLFGGFILDTRLFNTQLAVESGDTIVVGGIMRDSESDAKRGFPILGRIPIVNLVTRKKDTKYETTELIAFITPIVLRDSEAEAAATKDAAERVENIQEWRPYTDGLQKSEEKPKGLKKRLGISERRK
ncbi:MAG: hypothetical protein IT364_09115 [Candidatus Hydrogenedentes bacterium]|nr:hypothetical protein [Candidatus Hydrogenedentota bacterium]